MTSCLRMEIKILLFLPERSFATATKSFDFVSFLFSPFAIHLHSRIGVLWSVRQLLFGLELFPDVSNLFVNVVFVLNVSFFHGICSSYLFLYTSQHCVTVVAPFLKCRADIPNVLLEKNNLLIKGEFSTGYIRLNRRILATK